MIVEGRMRAAAVLMEPTALTSAHVRRASHLLRWNSAVIARKSHGPVKTLRLLRPSMTMDPEMAGKLRRVLEAAGVEFVAGDDGVGVWLRDRVE